MSLLRGNDELNHEFPNLTAEEEKEALRLQEIAERAERRALERAQGKTGSAENVMGSENGSSSSITSSNIATVFTSKKGGFESDNGLKSGIALVDITSNTKATFLTKEQRTAIALQKLEAKRTEQINKQKESEVAYNRFVTGKTLEERRREDKFEREKQERERIRRQKEENKEAKELDHEVKAIRDYYLGNVEKKRKITKASDKFAKLFKFDWEADDDTGRNDVNPLYNNRVKVSALFGRGYIAGVDQREQRKESNFLTALSEKRMNEVKRMADSDLNLSEAEKRARAKRLEQAAEALRRHQEDELKELDTQAKLKMGSHWSEKPLDTMTERDWRIFREDFDIRIQGGRATLPLRFWTEGNFPLPVMAAIKDMGYEKPSPIQRQAIPIGQAWRDIIGIVSFFSSFSSSDYDFAIHFTLLL